MTQKIHKVVGKIVKCVNFKRHVIYKMEYLNSKIEIWIMLTIENQLKHPIEKRCNDLCDYLNEFIFNDFCGKVIIDKDNLPLLKLTLSQFNC